jgi:predicted MFS family arabinose efflux permease
VVFAAGAVAGLAGLVTVPGLPGPVSERTTGFGATLRCGALLRPTFVFAAVTAAAGVVVGFLPLAAGGVASGALFAQSVSATVARWLAGRYGDRHGPAALLIPAVVLAAAGMLTLTLVGSPVAVVIGMVLFGTGFGAAQSSTLNLMLNRVGPAGYGPVSALWNVAYDGGMGLGAAGFGLLVTHTGFTAAFALTSAVITTAVLPALLDRTARTA